MQPTFAFPCEYDFSAVRKTYSDAIRFGASEAEAVPSGTNAIGSSYAVKTVPISNSLAIDLDSSLQELKGSFFYSQFYFDERLYKYRLVDDTWEWQVIGPTANVFTFQVERIDEPTVEFPVDYGQSQDNTVSAHIFRISATSDDAVPAITSRRLKTCAVTTRAMSKAAATALDGLLTGLEGTSFYSQLGLDTAPRLYRLQPFQWSWSAEGADAYVCSFTITEVIANSQDIPCIDTLDLQRTSRIRVAQFGDGYEQRSADGINTEDYVYSIETLPLSNVQAASLEQTLAGLKGQYFFSKFKNDTQVFKYRIDGGQWSWISSGQDANVFRFEVKRAYDL